MSTQPRRFVLPTSHRIGLGGLLRAGLLAGALGVPETAQAQTLPILPLEKVRLYEVGVGYFERSGQLPRSGPLTLPIPAGHLDDALKTLVVLQKDGPATVSGIQFASSVSRPLARALAGLPSGGDSTLGFSEILTSLRGVRVELRVRGEVLRGRLVELLSAEQSDLTECRATMPEAAKSSDKENKATSTPCVTERQPAVVIAQDSGEMRRLALREVIGVKPLDAALQKRFDTAISALSRGSVREGRPLEIMARGGSAVRLGYLAEAAVWRSNYRLVLSGAQRARLQGWALVHNDTDEDWKKVRLELVNGKPDSFLFPLAAPRYARRELKTPDQDLATVPQLLEGTPDELSVRGNIWGSEIGDAFGMGGLGLTGSGEGGGGRGEGIGMAAGAGAKQASQVVAVGDLAALAPSEGKESAALFQYALATPLDLRAQSSALVPFLETDLEARRIAWFTLPGQNARSALHLTNTSQQTLPDGTLAIFADGGFAGETTLARMKPSESQILEFGEDLDVELAEREHLTHEQPKLLHAAKGSLVEDYLLKHEYKQHLTNRSGSPRFAYIKLVLVNNAKITGADRVGYDAKRQQAYVAFEIKAKEERDLHFFAEEGLTRRFPVASVGLPELRRLASSPNLPPAQKQALTRAIESLSSKEKAELAQTRAGQRRKEAEQDLSRIRENLRTLQSAHHSDREISPMIQRMLATDQRLTDLRNEERIAAAHVRLHAAQARTQLRTLPTR